MKQKRIYPYLIDSNRIIGYYETLIEDGYKLKVFNRKEDKEVYDYFLPKIKDYMFWTFDLFRPNDYDNLTNDLKASVCGDYKCNVFEKGDTQIICFSTGICFVITEDKAVVNKIVRYENKSRMVKINLREDESYAVEEVIKEKDKYKEAHLYAYILGITEKIILNMIEKDLEDDDMFDRTRKLFSDFTKKIYSVDVTDKDDFMKKVLSTLEVEKKYIAIENKFDFLYKNLKIEETSHLDRICFVLFIIMVIIGIINLGLWLGR